MSTKSLVWYTAKREDIPEISFGIGDFRERSTPLRDDLFAPNDDVRVGFLLDSIGSLDYQPPSIFVLNGKTAPETLSWLRVYARSAFPLSQFGRVMTDADWTALSSDETDGRAIRTDKWSSVILGEILAQADFEGELDTLPISRATACFSSAIARTVFLHDSYAVTRTCTDRLREVAKDVRFGRRVIPVDMLVPIWAALSANVGDTLDIREVAELFLHAAEIASDARPGNHRQRELFNHHAQIFSDSVEERVVAFQRISSEIASNISLSPSPASYSAAMLALAAFLVGRGTSHVFLLKKFSTVAPLAFAWFGLAAALRGPRGWDPAWARVTKGIERQVRSAFHWSDPPAADICWAEYKWLSEQFSGTQALFDIARMAPRSLTIELVPGATCQFRTSETNVRHENEIRTPQSAPGLDQEVRSAFESLIALSNKAKRLLDRAEPSLGEQQGLPLKDSNSSTRSKSKRNAKRSPP
jgi:hypothetical protein